MAEQDDKKDTTLATKMQEIGRNILSAARETREEELKKVVVGRVMTILREIETLHQLKAECERKIKLFNNQIEALQGGQFELDRRTGAILFKDSDLNMPMGRDAHGNPIY